MKRRNVQEAFIGEPERSAMDALDNYADGDEAVDLEVRGGKIMLVVPAGTPDDKVFDSPTFIGGDVELEDGRVLSFQIEGDAVGAQVAFKPAEKDDGVTGLSTLPDIPSGV